MRPWSPRPTPRPARRGVLAVALLSLVAALGPVPASATPTPVPSPRATAAADPTPSATVAADPTPTSTPSATATVDPTPTPTPSATSTPDPTVTADSAAAPEVSALLLQAADDSRLSRAAAGAAALVDPRYEVVVLSTCATAEEPGLVNIAVAPRQDDVELALTFALSLDGRVLADGPLDLDSELGADVDLLDPERYVLTTYVDGATEPSTEADVHVARCLAPTAACTGVTFTNPPDNPAVGVVFGPAGADEEDAVDGLVFLAPGASRTIRVAYPELAWAAFSGGGLTDEEDDQDEDEDEDEPVALAGDGVLDLPRDCAGERLTTGQVGCVDGAGLADLELDVASGPARSFGYEVVDADGRVVAEDRVDPDGNASTTVSERLPGRGRYTYALYLEDAQLPYEGFDLTVLGCLDVDVTCEAVVLTNPARNPEVEVFYGTPGQVEPDLITLAPGGTRPLAWTERAFRWVADATEPAGITESVGRDDVAVPQGCGADEGAAPVSGPVAGPGLADTGAPAGAVVGLAGALALVVAGALLLVRGRRRA